MGTLRDGTPFLDQSLIKGIELYRTIILNPLSHARIAPVVKKEVSEAMKAAEKLEDKLAGCFESRLSRSIGPAPILSGDSLRVRTGDKSPYYEPACLKSVQSLNLR